MFENLKTDDAVIADKDVIGGNSFGPLETDVYDFTIEVAYVDQSAGGAMNLNLWLKDRQGNSLRQTVYMTSGTAKGGKNTYEVKGKDGKPTGERRYLPGFTVANDLCLLAIGKEIADLTAEEKVLNIFNFDLKKEVPTKKQVLTALTGAEISLGVVKQLENKNAKNDQGAYVPTGEYREVNEIDKVFRTKDDMTVSEITAESTEAVFRAKWLEKNKGVTRNKTGNKDAVATPKGGAAATTGATPTADATPAASLFNS